MDPYRPAQEPIETVAATQRWAATVLGAPADFGDLITGVVECDEVLVRVATEVQRRDVFVERKPGPQGRHTKPELQEADIFPWEISRELLREKSEHIAECVGCRGSGAGACGGCAGVGRVQCGNCGGTGKVWKQYQRSGKFIQCTVCRAGGTVRCGGCGGDGKVTCTGCGATGNQIVRADYGQTSRVEVALFPDSPVFAAHPYLRDKRVLAPAELAAFTIEIEQSAAEPLAAARLPEDAATLLHRGSPMVDTRRERVTHQQFLRFGAVRRDVSYELCGRTGTVVLSGKDLLGSRLPKAVGPIQTRLWIWGGVSLGAAVLAFQGVSAIQGTTAYFSRTNTIVAWLAVLVVAASIVAVGGLTRALRPGLKLRRLRTFDKAAAASVGLGLVAIALVNLIGKPTLREARSAIEQNDLPRARLVVEALSSLSLPPTELADLKDEVELAESKTLDPSAGLAVLDGISARGGTSAGKGPYRSPAEASSARRSGLGSQEASGRSLGS
jgi:hypothetical protein